MHKKSLSHTESLFSTFFHFYFLPSLLLNFNLFSLQKYFNSCRNLHNENSLRNTSLKYFRIFFSLWKKKKYFFLFCLLLSFLNIHLCLWANSNGNENFPRLHELRSPVELKWRLFSFSFTLRAAGCARKSRKFPTSRSLSRSLTAALVV